MSWISEKKRKISVICIICIFLHPFNPYYSKCGPVSVGITQELARNTESQPPSPAKSRTGTRTQTCEQFCLKRPLEKSYNKLYHIIPKSQSGYPLITDFRHTALHLSNLLYLLIPCSPVQSPLTSPGFIPALVPWSDCEDLWVDTADPNPVKFSSPTPTLTPLPSPWNFHPLFTLRSGLEFQFY